MHFLNLCHQKKSQSIFIRFIRQFEGHYTIRSKLRKCWRMMCIERFPSSHRKMSTSLKIILFIRSPVPIEWAWNSDHQTQYRLYEDKDMNNLVFFLGVVGSFTVGALLPLCHWPAQQCQRCGHVLLCPY